MSIVEYWRVGVDFKGSNNTFIVGVGVCESSSLNTLEGSRKST